MDELTFSEDDFKKKLVESPELNLTKYIQSLVRIVDPVHAYEEMMDILQEQVNADSVHIIVKNIYTNEYETKASTNLNEGEIDYSRTILEQTILNNQSQLIPNALQIPELSKKPSIMGRAFLSVITVPLSDENNNAIGAIYLARFTSPTYFTENDLKLAEDAANLLTPVLIHQEKLKQLEEVENLRYKSVFAELGMVIGKSEKMQEITNLIRKFAPFDVTVYIQGETGTGKELVARAIHKLSGRPEDKFIAINCGTIPKELAESELLGHEKGAFTGAIEKKIGKFELADGGTLFLDEISELPLDIQVKLLRIITEKKIYRVGGIKKIAINTRIIAASNKNLEEEVKKGNFRKDLFYRLNIATVKIPALRERQEMIHSLAHHFLKKYCRQFDQPNLKFTPEALDALEMEKWAGNVRQLENVIIRAILLHKSNEITVDDLFPEKDLGEVHQKSLKLSLDEEIGLLEKRVVTKAIKKNKGNITRTAKELRVSRNRLRKLLKKHNIKK
jgi:DNA-binding NtrC family response regulator